MLVICHAIGHKFYTFTSEWNKGALAGAIVLPNQGRSRNI